MCRVMPNVTVAPRQTCSLDDPELLPPQDHTRTSSKLGWVKLTDDLPKYREARYQG